MQTHDFYRDRNVRFLGLTEESFASLDQIERFVTQLDVPWPIGYGAGPTISALQAPGFPTTYVVGRDGNIVWNSFQSGTLDDAIKRAL